MKSIKRIKIVMTVSLGIACTNCLSKCEEYDDVQKPHLHHLNCKFQ